jgi:hypothetical protein
MQAAGSNIKAVGRDLCERQFDQREMVQKQPQARLIRRLKHGGGLPESVPPTESEPAQARNHH